MVPDMCAQKAPNSDVLVQPPSPTQAAPLLRSNMVGLPSPPLGICMRTVTFQRNFAGPAVGSGNAYLVSASP